MEGRRQLLQRQEGPVDRRRAYGLDTRFRKRELPAQEDRGLQCDRARLLGDLFPAPAHRRFATGQQPAGLRPLRCRRRNHEPDRRRARRVEGPGGQRGRASRRARLVGQRRSRVAHRQGERRLESSRHQLLPHHPQHRHRGVGRANPGGLRHPGLGVEVRAGAAAGALRRREPVSRHAVGRV